AIFQAAAWLRPLPEGFTRQQCSRVVQYWDLAFSERDTADYTVGVTLGRGESGALYVLGVHRARVTQEQLLGVIARQVHLWRPAVVGVEEAAYKAPVTRDLIGRLLRGELPAHFASVKPIADKVTRARLPAGRAEAGLLYCDRGAPWFEVFASELTSFPNGAHDDQVDALAGATQLALEWRPPQHARPIAWGGPG
ncbi:MAG TPA: phage terminase large subunit, partial [Kofleriaceae bacterium]|nr:phage terminase large subunit [Kofleriaceae bacterium]